MLFSDFGSDVQFDFERAYLRNQKELVENLGMLKYQRMEIYPFLGVLELGSKKICIFAL